MKEAKDESVLTTVFPPALLDGYRAFKDGRFAVERERYQQLAEEGQKPETLVIACCDSRAAPETIFNTAPGDIFVVRNVANLVPPYEPDGHDHTTSAAMEFAVKSLKVKHILVLGHSGCGGIKAALAPAFEPLSRDDFIGKWIQLARPAAEAIASDSTVTDADRQTALERLSIRYSVANLRSFDWIGQLVKEDHLGLHGAWFDIARGDLWVMDAATGDFAQAA